MQVKDRSMSKVDKLEVFYGSLVPPDVIHSDQVTWQLFGWPD